MSSAQRSTILNWNGQALAAFGRTPVMLNHTLAQHPLFAEAALARLLEKLGRNDYYVNTMDVASYDPTSRREGEIDGLSGAETLEAVRKGNIWILVLHPHKADPAYLDLLNEIYAEMEREVAGFKTDFRKMTILVSSPNVQVHYHCDIPGQTLWQVRGQKRVYVYPNAAPYLDQSTLEKIALGEAHEFALPYDHSFDARATIFDLLPGQMLHWPLNAPHRVVNADCVNVSFTTEHFTTSNRRQFYVNCANGVLRSRFGRTRLSQKISGPSYWAKLAVAAGHKLTGGKRKRGKVLKVDFAVDPMAPRSVRDIQPYELRR